MNSERRGTYMPAYQIETGENTGWELAFFENSLLLKKAGNGFRIPRAEEVRTVVGGSTADYIGDYEGNHCFCSRIDHPVVLPPEFRFAGIADITSLTGDAGLFILAGTAGQILRWNRINQYCGRCGHKTRNKTDERAKICPACGNVVYPRISPATITAVFRGDEILLAHNRSFKGNIHSLIAGFVEPGETLEQCAVREIREEVGIQVKNIRYFSSQPWPFPDSLMIAFTAEYESGEIAVDNQEITRAAWYNAGNLPAIPSTDSVAGKIIRRYRDRFLP